MAAQKIRSLSSCVCLLVKHFVCSLPHLIIKYFSKLKEKCYIPAWPCNERY